MRRSFIFAAMAALVACSYFCVLTWAQAPISGPAAKSSVIPSQTYEPATEVDPERQILNAITDRAQKPSKSRKRKRVHLRMVPVSRTEYIQQQIPDAEIAEQEAIEKAKEKLRTLKDRPKLERDAVAKELKTLLEQSFVRDLERRENQIVGVEARIKKLRDQIDKRKAAKEQIIDLRWQTIVNETEGLEFPSLGGTGPLISAPAADETPALDQTRRFPRAEPPKSEIRHPLPMRIGPGYEPPRREPDNAIHEPDASGARNSSQTFPDLPHPDEILRSRSKQPATENPFIAEINRKNVRMTVEPVAYTIGDSRYYPLVGQARLQNCRYKCTVSFDTTIHLLSLASIKATGDVGSLDSMEFSPTRSPLALQGAINGPIPFTHTKPGQEVVYIDQNHLIH